MCAVINGETPYKHGVQLIVLPSGVCCYVVVMAHAVVMSDPTVVMYCLIKATSIKMGAP